MSFSLILDVGTLSLYLRNYFPGLNEDFSKIKKLNLVFMKHFKIARRYDLFKPAFGIYAKFCISQGVLYLMMNILCDEVRV